TTGLLKSSSSCVLASRQTPSSRSDSIRPEEHRTINRVKLLEVLVKGGEGTQRQREGEERQMCNVAKAQCRPTRKMFMTKKLQPSHGPLKEKGLALRLARQPFGSPSGSGAWSLGGGLEERWLTGRHADWRSANRSHP
ncbi:hypothetical protein F7725_024386, partial [Dissostichus mawsoni]